MAPRPLPVNCKHYTPEGCRLPERFCPADYGCRRSCPDEVKRLCRYQHVCCPILKPGVAQ